MGNLLEVKGLTKSYENFVLQDFNLEIAPCETVGLIGTNGAGKTTLIKSVLGLVKKNAGSIKIFGQDAPNGATVEMRESIGVVFDTLMLTKSFAPKDVKALMGNMYANWDAQVFDQYIQEFQVPSFKKVEELSRGNSMKLSLAGALAASPKLLLLDEATAGLDPMVREEVLAIIRCYQLETECGILMCSHITSDLEKIADRIICLDNGKTAFVCGREEITDFAGLVRCRSVDFEALIEEGYFQPGAMRFERGAYGINVLVSDRYDFMKKYPEIPCDHCTIEDYMRICLKGEQR